MTGEDKEELESVSLTLEESIDYLKRPYRMQLTKR